MNNKCKIILGLSLSIMALSAAAESKIISKDRGAYLGIQGGYGWLNFANDSNNGGFSVNPYFGARFNPYFAVEIGYIRFPNVTYWKDQILKGNYALYFAGKAIAPMGNRFKLYAKLGVAAVSATYSAMQVSYDDSYYVIPAESEHAAALYTAIGIGVAVNSHIDFDVESAVIRKTHDIPAMAAVMAGLSCTF